MLGVRASARVPLLPTLRIPTYLSTYKSTARSKKHPVGADSDPRALWVKSSCSPHPENIQSIDKVCRSRWRELSCAVINTYQRASTVNSIAVREDFVTVDARLTFVAIGKRESCTSRAATFKNCKTRSSTVPSASPREATAISPGATLDRVLDMRVARRWRELSDGGGVINGSVPPMRPREPPGF